MRNDNESNNMAIIAVILIVILIGAIVYFIFGADLGLVKSSDNNEPQKTIQMPSIPTPTPPQPKTN